MRSRGLLTLVFALAVARPGRADDQPSAVQALRTKEAEVAALASSKEALAQKHAFAAYRLSRQRALGAQSSAEDRLARTQALTFATLALGRSSEEAALLRDEQHRLSADRAALEHAAAMDAPGPDEPALPSDIVAPVAGTVIATPGVRKDLGSGVSLRTPAVVVHARAGTDVRTALAGTVARVETLPQGGYAVVVAHESRFVSVTCGLRDVTVVPGTRVALGQPLGVVGRTLDGAPVVTFELWNARTPVDAAPVFGRRRNADAEPRTAMTTPTRRREQVEP